MYLYQIFDTVKRDLDNPVKIDSSTNEYLCVRSGVNVYQRQQLKYNNGGSQNGKENAIIIIEKV